MERIVQNPFYVLELAPTCSRAEVERASRRLLDMLAVGLCGAQAYASPVGPRQRDEALVRWAAAELRDPQKRLVHELWMVKEG